MDVMEKNWKKTLVAAVLCGSLVAACGPKIPHPPAPGSVVAFSPAQEAKASMDAAIAAVNAGRLDQVYGMLPESYRNDLADVVRAYASKIDRHLYEQGAGVLAAAGELIAAQARNLEDLLGGHAGNLAFDLPDAVDMTAVTEEQIRQAGQWIAGAAKSLSYDDFAEGNIRPLLSNPLAAGLLQKVFKVFPAFPQSPGPHIPRREPLRRGPRRPRPPPPAGPAGRAEGQRKGSGRERVEESSSRPASFFTE